MEISLTKKIGLMAALFLLVFAALIGIFFLSVLFHEWRHYKEYDSYGINETKDYTSGGAICITLENNKTGGYFIHDTTDMTQTYTERHFQIYLGQGMFIGFGMTIASILSVFLGYALVDMWHEKEVIKDD